MNSEVMIGTSYTKLIHQDMLNLKKTCDYVLDPSHGYAVAIDISRAPVPSLFAVDRIALELMNDHQRKPSAIYYSTPTLILFFKAKSKPQTSVPTEESKPEEPHIFGGSHQKIIAWFSGYINLLFGVVEKSQLVISVITEFKTSLQATEYFLWASQLNERSYLGQKVLERYPSLDCRELTFKELESRIDPAILVETRQRYGWLILYDGEVGKESLRLRQENGPFRGDQVDKYMAYF